VAIDEVQLAADLERGHVFTDRILHRRGRDETLLLGAGTMRPIIERCCPASASSTRPRLSHLEFAGEKQDHAPAARSAIVAFSADEVYAIAELIRRQRGGAAVVLGALSPRTRNAQVALYQNGDVDYLMAPTRSAWASISTSTTSPSPGPKFDGYQFRNLNPAELAPDRRPRRAASAGWHLRLEGHQFDNVKVLQWRPRDLDFSSLQTLRESLDATPTVSGTDAGALPAVDSRRFEHLSRYPEIRDIATTPRVSRNCGKRARCRITGVLRRRSTPILFRPLFRSCTLWHGERGLSCGAGPPRRPHGR
jgi:ATP-dependent RNA helicase SUPV3L1/SUV3